MSDVKGVEQAVALARLAYENVLDRAMLVFDPAVEEQGADCYVLVDGQDFSPSTRALPYGQATWLVDTHDVFVYEFDLLVDQCAAFVDTGYTLTWDEGMLTLRKVGT